MPGRVSFFYVHTAPAIARTTRRPQIRRVEHGAAFVPRYDVVDLVGVTLAFGTTYLARVVVAFKYDQPCSLPRLRPYQLQPDHNLTPSLPFAVAFWQWRIPLRNHSKRMGVIQTARSFVVNHTVTTCLLFV